MRIMLQLVLSLLSLSFVKAKGEPLPSLELTGHSGALTVLAWSPDSQVLASSAGWFESQDATGKRSP